MQEITPSLNGYIISNDINKIVIKNEQVIKFDLSPNWNIRQVLTDYMLRGGDTTELILVLEKKQ